MSVFLNMFKELLKNCDGYAGILNFFQVTIRSDMISVKEKIQGLIVGEKIILDKRKMRNELRSI